MEKLTPGKRIENRIKHEGRTMTWVANQLGLSKSSLSQRIHDVVDFKFSELKNLEILFPNITKDIFN